MGSGYLGRLFAAVFCLFCGWESGLAADEVGGATLTLGGEVDHGLERIVIKAGRSEIDTRLHYFIGLVELVLDHSQEQFGPYSLVQSKRDAGQGRIIAEMAQGEGDVTLFWSATSQERERLLNPIRIPLTKGLLGHRIFIIRRGEQERFSGVERLSDLHKFLACQGAHWPDTRILKDANLRVETSADYPELFRMVADGRCDYFPRALQEPYAELAARKDQLPNLVIEDSLMLQYPMPVYFFTRRSDAKLADRVTYGLTKAYEDGSFEGYFATHPLIKSAIERSTPQTRRMFKLENNALSNETPLDVARYWYSL